MKRITTPGEYTKSDFTPVIFLSFLSGLNDFPISENSMTACLNYTLLHETKHALCRRIVRCNPACLTFVVVVVVFKPMPSVSVEGTLLGLTITNWSRVNLAFASLCNTFSSDTALKAAAAVSARNINTRFLCCVYVSNHRSTGVTLNGSQIRAYWSESKTDADGGLWLQPACQAAGLDVCSYIIKKEKKNTMVMVPFVSQLNNYGLELDE